MRIILIMIAGIVGTLCLSSQRLTGMSKKVMRIPRLTGIRKDWQVESTKKIMIIRNIKIVAFR